MQFGTQHLWYAMFFNLHAAPSNDPLVQKCSLLKVGLKEQYYATAEPGPIYLSLIIHVARSAGRKRKGSLQLHPWNLNSTSNSPVAPRCLSCQISRNQREVEKSANVNNHWKARAKGNDVITNVFSANHHLASPFSMQIFKIQRRSYKLSFRFPPRRQSAPENLLSG